MSIIIKSDELNILIYKYLQECNLVHTAFTFFTQANLDQSLSQYKFDVKSGHLVSMIERALIFSQIESHITINSYEQCKEPFYLLKPHVCKITQKAKQQKQKLIQQLNENVFSMMRRVSGVHNTLQPNRQYEQIIYQQRTANFLDKIPLTIADSGNVNLKISKGLLAEQKFICAYEQDTYTMTFMNKKDKYLSIIGVLPCKKNVKIFEISEDILINVYEHNQCEVIQLSNKGIEKQLFLFKLSFKNQCRHIKINRKIKNLIAFQSQNEYCVININTKKQLLLGEGQFQWVDAFNYLIFNSQSKKIKKYSLKPDEHTTFHEFNCPISNSVQIKVSFSQIFFSVQSMKEKLVYIYNFDQQEPLYIFDFNESQIEDTDEAQISQNLIQVLWVSAKNTDKLILITDFSIKTFDLELNNFSKIIQIGDYDIQVIKAGALRKSSEQMYLVALGSQNIIFYDVYLGKIERVQISQQIQPKQILQLNENYYLGIATQDRICILEKSDVQPLFL